MSTNEELMKILDRLTTLVIADKELHDSIVRFMNAKSEYQELRNQEMKNRLSNNHQS